ncbi:hypothetical protein [Tessaracoccus caeni]|uniref:hypothetical protein n=1 Tax=Tessaracoccus caeni TaxID=3031239 RepID=UPI0023DA39A3|nr:hypothetical protein [Tessaracoccus caeni]MDF1490301.1 hypothetical protein [Tessaracoccus caeni]
MADWVAVLIAVLAVIAAIWSARQSDKVAREVSNDARDAGIESAKAAAYQRLHELLVDPKAARGRRLLFIAARHDAFPNLGDPDWDEINYSLALYDSLGGYIVQGFIDEKIALRAWHHPLKKIHGPVNLFMKHRAENEVSQPWSYLINLLSRAQRYECDCPQQLGHVGLSAVTQIQSSSNASPQT